MFYCTNSQQTASSDSCPWRPEALQDSDRNNQMLKRKCCIYSKKLWQLKKEAENSFWRPEVWIKVPPFIIHPRRTHRRASRPGRSSRAGRWSSCPRSLDQGSAQSPVPLTHPPQLKNTKTFLSRILRSWSLKTWFAVFPLFIELTVVTLSGSKTKAALMRKLTGQHFLLNLSGLLVFLRRRPITERLQLRDQPGPHTFITA